MNIREAKEQIRSAMRAYFARDEYGNLLMPPEAQRPVFLLGPPGIGKTAVMRQIASELGVGLVSYSMTHHTRQSALGLPLIVRKNYGGREYAVTEYTMSEIIASVYDTMEESGVKEGILFLDEINCVSETLTPTMLQFLQFKTFGRHAVPGGWIVVTAGNPPEYNRSAREFDIVTWDRLKRIDVEPDYGAWRDYAREKGVHAAVLTYLDAKKENFYRVEATVDGRRFVTARGWDDLSDMIALYERCGLTVDALLIGQYLQDADIAADFAAYYELFHKYQTDYRVGDILAGTAPAEIAERARAAAFDERLSLLGLLLDSALAPLRAVIETEDVLAELLALLRPVKAGASLEEQRAAESAELEKRERRGALSAERRRRFERVLAFLAREARAQADFPAVKADYDGAVAAMRADAAAAGAELEHLFAFAEEAWGEGQELLLLVTELTASPPAARFIARYGCEPYYRHNRALAFHERRAEILRRLERLELEL